MTHGPFAFELVLHALHAIGPLTGKELSAIICRSESTVRDSILNLHKRKLISLHSRRGASAVYAAGGEDDEEGASTSARVLAWLTDVGPATSTQLAKKLGITPFAAASAVHRLNKVPGQLHVHGWHLPRIKSGREARIWAAGPGEDAPRPDFSNARAESFRRNNVRRRAAKPLTALSLARRPPSTMEAVRNPFEALMR